MSRVPVAKRSPIPSEWKFPKRGLAIALLLVGMFAVGGVILATLWSTTDGAVWAARVDQLQPSTPMYNSHGFYVVLLPSGEIIALLERDPRQVPGATTECTIDWRPDFVFDNKKGWFRGGCSGSTFMVNGAKVFGPSPRSMDRYAVDVTNGDVLVNTRRVLQCAPVGADFSQLECSSQ